MIFGVSSWEMVGSALGVIPPSAPLAQLELLASRQYSALIALVICYK